MMQAMNIMSVGIIIIIIGLLIVIIGSLLAATNSQSNVKVSFFGLIGPIPFGFSNDKRLFITSIVLTVALVILMLFFRGAKWP